MDIGQKRENHYIIFPKKFYLYLSKEGETLCVKTINNPPETAGSMSIQNRQKIYEEKQE